MEYQDLLIGMAGSGGDGVVTTGEILVNASASVGLNAFMLKSFGPQIRGGESSCQVRISAEQLYTHGDKVQILGIFNWNDFKRFRNEMNFAQPLVIVQEADDKTPDDKLPIDDSVERIIYKVPLNELAKEKAGTSLAKNIVMLGVLAELFGLPEEGLRKAITRQFKKKKQEVIDANLAGFKAGAEYVRDQIEKVDDVRFSYTPSKPKAAMEGNETFAYGALYAGCRFFAGYPITPSSEVMEWMSRELPKYNGTMLQAEDELAAIGMIIGASFAGQKAMTSTSGPGVSLMSEQIGLASIAEIPLVILNVQRGGPSTGIPTKTEQADLYQALYGTHGDVNKVVLAPADVQDCFDVAIEAFYAAEKFQLPVIVLSDQYVGQRTETLDPEEMIGKRHHNGSARKIERLLPTQEELEDYKRFRVTENGISPMTYPGIPKGMYQAAGIEHNEQGLPSSDVTMHQKLTEKRFRKNETIAKEMDFIRFYGPDEATVGVIAWGSTKGAVKEALEQLNGEGYKVKAAVPQILYPLPKAKLTSFIESLGTVIIPELNYGGQFFHYLKSEMDFGSRNVKSYARSGGSPLSVDEIYETIKEELD